MSGLSPIAGLKDVYYAQSGKLSCVIFKLQDESLCIYSPIAGLATPLHAQLTGLGGVGALLAPNHYHNKGLQDHLDGFPKAKLYCTTNAKPRLQKITGLTFLETENLMAALPAHVRFLMPEGLKTGEVWLEITQGNDIAWVVADAFTAKRLQADQYADGPEILGSFPKFGVKNAALYKSWVQKQISAQAPTLLIPCHGSPVKSPNLGAALLGQVDDTF